MADDIPKATDLRPVDLDPKLLNIIGLHHSLATALADLVDNSLDAHAGTIRIRFLMDGAAPVGLQVIDDGDGMDDRLIDRAMTYAGTREYGA
ncbi:MAG: ATP-binding protein, partial [Actinomycetota bacterium]|nr:ATP-binding protein [Actinomycetota bacterium]